MDLYVFADGTARFGDETWLCALGRSGVSTIKREGDGATPVGSWQLRPGFYRPDRLALPETRLALRPLNPDDGWCDDPSDARYNLPVTLPYPARCEALWRKDSVYDLIIPLGYNDDPVVPGLGSAIFLHLARHDAGPTEGCVALALPNLLEFLVQGDSTTRVIIQP